jgi:nucleotide-binding universal stress UspA family protein
MGQIVVGVDGSDDAQRALRWAAQVAARDGAELTAMYAYPSPPTGDESLPSVSDLRHDALRMVEDAIAKVAPAAGVAVRPVVRPAGDSPAAVLLEEAKHADLLVVGSRGIGGFMALRLGSVSAQCVEYATCPVVVFPPLSHD